MQRTFLIFVLLSILNSCYSKPGNNFQALIGPEKTQVLEHAKTSFRNFLTENFDGSNKYEKTLAFLTFLDTAVHGEQNWKLDLTSVKHLIDQYEQTGLRKDFRLYAHENYDTVLAFKPTQGTITRQRALDSVKFNVLEVKMKLSDSDPANKIQKSHDSLLLFNRYGRYQFGLRKYYVHDQVVQSYLKAIDESEGNMAYQIIAGGLRRELQNKQALTPGVELIILFELYLPCLENKLEKGH